MDWTELDGSNTSAPPDGAPAGMAANASEGVWRAIRGATKRFWNRINGTVTSGGTNTVTLTYTVAPAAYVTGEVYTFKAGGTNTGATTLNVNTLGAKAIQYQGAALAGNEIVLGRMAIVVYDGTQFQLINSQSAVLASGSAAGGNLTGTYPNPTVAHLNASNIDSGTLPPARLNGLNQIGAVLGSDTALNNTGSYFTGPSIAQGSTGIWVVTGCVTLVDTSISADFNVKLWDGTTVVASGKVSTVKVNGFATVALTGTITSPAGDLRISVQDLTTTSGSIQFNASGNSKDSYIVAYRIA